MKVRVTFDVTDTDRIAIGVLIDGKFAPASHETTEAYLAGVVHQRLARLRAQFDLATQSIIDGMEQNTEEANQ